MHCVTSFLLFCLVASCLCQPSTYKLPSSCEYTFAAVKAEGCNFSEVRERNCNQHTTEFACLKQGYCWWRDTTAQNSLVDHQFTFNTPTIYNPAQGVYVAVGYDLGNSILIVNEGKSIVIDTLGSLASGRAVVEAFETYLGMPIPPVAAVIYTHSHPDHIGGTAAFDIPPGTPIYAQASFGTNLRKTVETQSMILARGSRQFGFLLQQDGLHPDGFLGDGIGPSISNDALPKILPNAGFLTALNVTIAGLELRMFSTPGETDDTLAIYIDSIRTVFVGDNIYSAFPNLYAIRGTPPRDVKQWFQSVDKIRALDPVVVIGSHTPPLTTNIQSTLTNYRDAIQYVNDQTVMLINQGVHPADIAAQIRLPEHLASEPYLQQFYGYVPFCVRSVFTSYLGWFSGDIAELNALPTQVEATRLVKLAGGPAKALNAAVNAINEGTAEGTQWTLQVVSAVLKVISTDSPYFPQASELYIQAGRQLGYASPSITGRNYYLQTVQEFINGHSLQTGRVRSVSGIPKEMYFDAPTATFMDTLGSLINIEKTQDVHFSVEVSFLPSVEESLYVFETVSYFVDIRRQIAEVYPTSFHLPSHGVPDLTLTVANPAVFKSLILNHANVKAAMNQGYITSSYPIEVVEYFFELFQK